MKNATWENWLGVVAGIWIMLSPWVFPGHGGGAASLARVLSESIAGAVIFAGAALALQDLDPSEEWAELVAGVWLFISPWALGYAGTGIPFWNATATGFVVALAAVLAMPAAREAYRRKQRS
jgi:hypothetical protein